MTGKRAGGVAAMIVGVAAMASSCTKTQLQGDSSSYLIINNFQAASVHAAGGSSPTFSGVLDSDVCVHPKAPATGCGVFEDLGQATFQLALKDPGTAAAPNTPSTPNFVTLSRYHVDYIRADGRNTQGVDVPFSFDGAVTVTVGSSAASAVITLVRVQAKLEAPLAGLANLTSTVAISTIARVTFYGTDQAGRDVSVVGQIGVNFADWADPLGSSGS
jgi:hypothetical protein